MKMRGRELCGLYTYVAEGTLAPGMEIGYLIKDARKWKVYPERIASESDAECYRGLPEKAWGGDSFCV